MSVSYIGETSEANVTEVIDIASYNDVRDTTTRRDIYPLCMQVSALRWRLDCHFFASCISIILLSFLLSPSNFSLSFSFNLSKEMKTEDNQKEKTYV